jgi:hypothetical protein
MKIITFTDDQYETLLEALRYAYNAKYNESTMAVARWQAECSAFDEISTHCEYTAEDK